MRITNKMLSSNFLYDMQNNLQNLKTLQGQLSSGKEIRRPSDDPFKVARAMQMHTDITSNKQYNTNIKDTINWLDQTDTALNQLGNQFQRMRELMVSSGNAAYGSDERQKIKDEINGIISNVSQTLNASFDGKYIFGGTRGTSKPVVVNEEGNNNIITYKTADGNAEAAMSERLVTEISQGVTVEYNVTSTDVLQFTDGKGISKDVRDILKDIVNHLDGKVKETDADGKVIWNENTSSASDALSGKDLEDMDAIINNILKLRSQVGAKTNAMDSAKEKNLDENLNLTEILSETEDIDITEKTMQFATAQTVYIAALQTSAKVIQPTLMDYL
ncbi:flagellar hook-associated protein FlgL [Clostridium sp. HMP27]|uniref:flagellar hook-associated protein FlgL n=1 Tax=Clostridium sp. HMP27 TaxID=1487921 RepID=UPI00052E3C9D|nr:flagellar hook-associated protein FlgL [Clostridium sp. HMP27]KGK86052.1 flagellin [Clostridium sp. HMP27]